MLYISVFELNNNVTVQLVQNWVISNGPLYGVSYFYAALLFIIYLSSTLYSWSTIILFCGCFINKLLPDSADILVPNPYYASSG